MKSKYELMLEPSYLYLIKNLRGIIYTSKELPIENEVKWLKRKFKYRELGISETLDTEKKWRNLTILPKIVEDPTLDSILQASKHICPLIILKEESLKDFKDSIIAKIKTKNKLNDKDLKFNLRLVNYSITDFYLKSIELAIKSNMDERRKLVEKDLKRFWRIKRDEAGKTLITYIDPLLMEKNISNPIYMSIIPCLILDLNK
ncbi:MAG: hypothetical protein QXI93_03720 [Candidatus Methanomethylicia archaeon]